MKALLLILTLFTSLLISTIVHGQASLPLNEKGKVSFLEIVKADTTEMSTLYQLADNWIRKNFKSNQMTSHKTDTAGFINSEGSFLVYNKGIISKEPHGRIRFNISIDVKNNKYRYCFTDFVFEYYKQNREYKFVATGKEKPLEETKSPGWQSLWDKHRLETNKVINNYIVNLKTSMIPKKEPLKEVRQQEKW